MSQREVRIDALKFCAIALVVFSHVLGRAQWVALDDQIVYVITRFNMPLFMFLSGYVLYGREGTNARAFLGRKFRALLVPRHAWLLVYGLLAGSSATGLADSLLNATVDASGLWFVYVLFLFFVIFSMTRLLPSSDKILVAVAVILTVLQVVVQPSTKVLGVAYYWLIVYFVAGYLMAKHKRFAVNLSPRAHAVAPVVFVTLVALALPVKGSVPNWYPTVREALDNVGLPGSYPLVVLNDLVLAAAGIATSWSVYALLPDALIKPHAWAGQRSLGVYLAEGMFAPLLLGTGLLGALGTSFVVVVCALALTLALERIPVFRTLLLGKPWWNRP